MPLMSEKQVREKPRLAHWLAWYGPSTAALLALATALGLLSIYAAQSVAR